MSLNIKNEDTHALVRELAALTGLSQTSAVDDAVRRRLDELRATGSPVEAKLAEIRRIADAFNDELTDEQREGLRRADEELYDESGLPA